MSLQQLWCVDTLIVIILMKYLLSANLQYIPELGALYRKKRRKKKAKTVQQQ